jgi:molybdopterin-guanine dinucleotide biosynthesis protein A
VRLTALILAGGQSRRMGRDKLSLPRRPGSSETVLEHVVNVALATADRAVVVVPPDGASTRIPGAENRFLGAGVLADPVPHRGPLYALACAWENPALTDCDAVLVLAGDLPGLAADVVNALVGAVQAKPDADGAVVVRQGQDQPLIAIYRLRVGQAFQEAVQQGETRLLKVTGKLRLARVDADQMGWPQWWTRPIHTPIDYQEWLLETEDTR